MTDFKFASGKEPYLTKTSLAYMYSRLNNVSELKTTQNVFGGVVYHYPTLYEYTYSYTVSLLTVQMVPVSASYVNSAYWSWKASFWDKKFPQNDVFWFKRHDFMTWKWANHPQDWQDLQTPKVVLFIWRPEERQQLCENGDTLGCVSQLSLARLKIVHLWVVK